MQLYHDARGELPAGATELPRQTWVMRIWPFIEQNNLASRNNIKEHFHNPPVTIGGTMNGLAGQYVAMYYCPSDHGSDLTVSNYQRRRGNYVVNWGSVTYGPFAGAATIEANSKTFAPFSHIDGVRTKPRVVQFEMITDGLSNTLMMSEYLMAQSSDDNDWRGDIHNDQGVFRFHTLQTPNTSARDIIASSWFVDSDPVMMPVAGGAFEAQRNAARSRHGGGVNALLCDGSVSFYNDEIALNVWQALATMNGAEVAN
jgi:prepilin-type processing-associated H-X9-DG protein